MAHKWKLFFVSIAIGLWVACCADPEFNVSTFSDDCMCEDIPEINCTSDSCNCKKNVCQCVKDKPSDNCILESCECEENSPSADCKSGLCNCRIDIPSNDCKENSEKKTSWQKVCEEIFGNKNYMSEDEAKWDDYGVSMPELKNGEFKVYECFWRKQPGEWIVYRKKGNGTHWCRFPK